MQNRRQEVLHKTILKLLHKNAHRRILHIINKIHIVDLAVIFRLFNDEQQDILFSLLPDAQTKAELLEHIDESIAIRLIASFSNREIVEVLEEMSDDDAADLLQELPEEDRQAIFAKMKRGDREEFRELIAYEEETAGGLMTFDFITVKADALTKDATETIQQAGEEAETVFYVYVVDEAGRLEGVVSLREIVQADELQPIREIMQRDIHKVRIDTDQEEVARAISLYDLLAIPVVDEENTLKGIITVDDIIDVIREEATEDILKLVGTDEELLDDYSIRKSITSRLPWLFATWIAGILVMKLLKGYEDELTRFVALSAFFPIILGMSGNVGQQSATIVVRGLAVGLISVSELFQTIWKEAITGLVMGLVYGLLLAGVAYWQFGEKIVMIPLVVGLAQISAILFAAIFGAFVPMFLSKLKIDPAVATGPIVTTSLDLFALWIYMFIASIFIF